MLRHDLAFGMERRRLPTAQREGRDRGAMKKFPRGRQIFPVTPHLSDYPTYEDLAV